MPEIRHCLRCGDRLTVEAREGIDRFVCSSESCGYVYWDNPLPVVAAVVEYHGDVILIRQRGWPEKWFGLVTGFLEKNETPEEGILREIKEEIGLEGKVMSLIGIYPFFQRNELIIAYHVLAKGSIQLGEEIIDFRRVAPKKLRPWSAATGLAVKDWLTSLQE
ncbi:NUDIX domain-containing protein [Thermodesulfobacteriota bacterium]